jgi:hypothetical protein
MRFRQIMLAVSASAIMVGAAFADTDPNTAALARATLNEIQTTPADKEAVMNAINRATQGAELQLITEAVCQLRQRRDIDEVVGNDPAALVRATATLGRPEVHEALVEACDVAMLALASYGATGGVPAGAPPGQALGSGGIGAPGGGGGSGYTN